MQHALGLGNERQGSKARGQGKQEFITGQTGVRTIGAKACPTPCPLCSFPKAGVTSPPTPTPKIRPCSVPGPIQRLRGVGLRKSGSWNPTGLVLPFWSMGLFQPPSFRRLYANS